MTSIRLAGQTGPELDNLVAGKVFALMTGLGGCIM